MQGTVLEVRVAEGDAVERGQVICIVEAMKMENELAAHRDGIVEGLSVAAGDAVTFGQTICVVSPNGDAPAPCDAGFTPFHRGRRCEAERQCRECAILAAFTTLSTPRKDVVPGAHTTGGRRERPVRERRGRMHRASR